MTTKYFCQTETGREKKDHLYLEITRSDDKVIIGADNVDDTPTGGIYLIYPQVVRLVEQLTEWLAAQETPGTQKLWEEE